MELYSIQISDGQNISQYIKMNRTSTEGSEQIQKNDSLQQVQKWVRTHGPDIKSSDWIRQRYYNKLNIDLPIFSQLQKKQEIANEQLLLKIFMPKSGQEIRQRYINKLFNMGIMKTQPVKKYQHLFIFDWDDTLLCTSFLNTLNFTSLTSETKQQLNKLDERGQSLLRQAVSKGTIYIITNATKGWVQHSSRLYLPLTNSLITSQNTIRVISARSAYSNLFPGDYGRWKIQAFKSILHKIDTNVLTNMICLGDSNIQIEAAHCLSKQFDKIVLKTIKFREDPKPDQMVKQIGLVIDKFRQIFDSNKNLTIRLQRKK